MIQPTRAPVPVNPKPPRQPRRPTQPRPHVREVECYPAVVGTGADHLIHVWQDGCLSVYWLRRLVSDYGVAYEFQQGGTNPARGGLQAEKYDVCVELDGASCECPGHLRHSVECKHIWALRELLTRGALAPRYPDPDDIDAPCGSCFDAEIPDFPF